MGERVGKLVILEKESVHNDCEKPSKEKITEKAARRVIFPEQQTNNFFLPWVMGNGCQ